MNKSQAESDLAFIKQVMEESKSVLVENGLRFIAWGVLAIACTFLTYGAVSLKLFDAVPWIWVGFALAGAATTVFLGRHRKKRAVRTLAGKIYGFVWLGSILFMAIATGCIAVAGKFTLALMLSIVSGGLGMAYFVSSTIIRNRLMFALSFVWWAGSFIIAWVGNYYAPIVLVGFVFICEVVPGCILYRHYRRQTRRSGGGGPAPAKAG